MISQKIKICGLTTIDAIIEINAQHIGFAGFIAYHNSPRHLDIEKYYNLKSALNPQIKSVLVTVDATEELIAEYLRKTPPDFLQLHGSETPQKIASLKQQTKIPIIKAIPASENLQAEIEKYVNLVDMLLFDTQANGSFGGTGKSFNWEWLANKNIPIPYFLSGGIGAHNIESALQTRANFIDVSSSLEQQKAIKDVQKIKDFMDIVRNCDISNL